MNHPAIGARPELFQLIFDQHLMTWNLIVSFWTEWIYYSLR